VNHSFDEEMKFERHRAYAEEVIYHKNWLPSWFICWYLDGFSDHAERFLRGEPQPPLAVRMWWAFKHWRFKKGLYRTSRRYLQEHHKTKTQNPMAQSKATGEFFKPGAMIPLAPGQRLEYIPVRGGDMVQLTDANTGERRAVLITPDMRKDMREARAIHMLHNAGLLPGERMIWHTDDGEDVEVDVSHLRDRPFTEPHIDTTCIGERLHVTKNKEHGCNVFNYNGLPVAPSSAIPNSLGDYPRPNCPKCHTPNPELGTPLNPKSPSGWGDSYFTCTNHKCRHKWKWKKVFPGLEENKNKEGTKTGAVLKGTDVPFHIFGKAGATVEQLNEAVKAFGRVACLANMTPEQRLQIAKIQQQETTCQEAKPLLARITNHSEGRETSLEKAYRRRLVRNLGVDHR
jgi:hypothetical protein